MDKQIVYECETIKRLRAASVLFGGREGSDDRRPSREERYSSVDDYLRQIRAAIESLVQADLMLPEDTDTLVADCRMAYLDSFGDDSG